MIFEELKQVFPLAIESEWHQHEKGGGWVENTAWVYGNARVYGNALHSAISTRSYCFQLYRGFYRVQAAFG